MTKQQTNELDEKLDEKLDDILLDYLNNHEREAVAIAQIRKAFAEHVDTEHLERVKEYLDAKGCMTGQEWEEKALREGWRCPDAK